jgi:hypothetical protein
MAPAGFELEIPARGQPQTHALDGAATVIGVLKYYENNLITRKLKASGV